MTSPLIYFTEGSRILMSSLKQRFSSKVYDGTAQEICTAIVAECWNGRFYQTSAGGNFAQFWTRDFGMCTASLLKLGKKEEVHQTLRYALHRFREHKKITTTITPPPQVPTSYREPLGTPYDFPRSAIDSLAWLIHSLALSKFQIYEYHDFLQQEVMKFFTRFIDPVTGLVKGSVKTSSIKDFAIRKSSCYDNCMVGMLARDLDALKMVNPLAKYDYPVLLLQYFWNGKYFYDDLQKLPYVAGDANVFPFVCGLVRNEQVLRSALLEVQKAGLDTPFPLKYTHSRSGVRFIPQELLLWNYESTSIWMHMGPLYVKLVAQIDPVKAQDYKEMYTRIIEKHKNYIEVFTADGKPYRSVYYAADRGMLWAVNYLTL